MLNSPFSYFFNQSKLTFLNEGGNVRITTSTGDTIQANKLDLNKHSRSDIVDKLLNFFHSLNLKFEQEYGEKIWPLPLDIDSGHIFNGSSEHFFNSNIADEEFVKHKPIVGDIDVAVPSKLKEKIFEFLSSNKEKRFTTHCVFLGSKQDIVGEGHQTNCLVRIDDEINIQIDFEYSSYENNKPSKFAKFSHSASWSDIKQGYKGVLHKYLLQSIASSSLNMSSEEAVLFTKAATFAKPRISKAFPEKGISFRKFSVGKGLRTDAYEPVLDPEGKPAKHEDKIIVKERPTHLSTYIQDPELIAREVFGEKFNSKDIEKFNSFIGLIDLCNKYMESSKKTKILKNFFHRLFGSGSQGFERNNPKGDYSIKRAGFEYLRKNLDNNMFPELPETYEQLMSLPENDNSNETLLKIKNYYENYVMSSNI
jgi:hypothetical protein